MIAVFVVHYAIQYIPQLSKNGFNVDLGNIEIPFLSKKSTASEPSHKTEAAVAADTHTGTKDLKRLTLHKNYGMTIPDVQSCPIFLPGTLEKDTRCKQPHKYDTGSHCTNGKCSMTVEFGDDVPKLAALCVKQGDDCVLKYFDVPKPPEVIGYTASFELTPEIKSQLGIQGWEDKITFENANGYSLEDDIYTVSYSSLPTEDNLLVNDKFKLKVKFQLAP